jgi:microcystin-dependent protein
LPLHTHPVVGIAASATAPNPGPNVTMAMSPTGTPIYGAANNPVKLSAQAITAAGGGQPHENRQPNLGITYIIAMQGIFPPRS